MFSRTERISGTWTAAVRSAASSVPAEPSSAALEGLRERTAALVWRGDCPRAESIGEDRDGYRRYLIADEREAFSAVLISWPPGHRTALHDHDGLWGMELVLDGAIEVEEYSGGSPLSPAALILQRRIMLGVGDATVFSNPDYVHSCRNLSPNRPALSLHVYGGALEHYNTFAVDGSSGLYRAAPQSAPIDVAWT